MVKSSTFDKSKEKKKQIEKVTMIRENQEYKEAESGATMTGVSMGRKGSS